MGTNEKTEQAEAGNGAAHAEWLAEINELKQRLRDRAEAIGRREQELRKEEQRLEHHERRLGRRARVLRAQRHWFLPLTERKRRQPSEEGRADAGLESRARSIAEHERRELRIEEVEGRAAQLQAAGQAQPAARSEADAREGQLEAMPPARRAGARIRRPGRESCRDRRLGRSPRRAGRRPPAPRGRLRRTRDRVSKTAKGAFRIWMLAPPKWRLQRRRTASPPPS